MKPFVEPGELEPPGPLLPLQRAWKVLVCTEPLTWLLLLLFVCLRRYLHHSGVLTMDALEEPPLEPVECPEEDIADKVGAGCLPEDRGMSSCTRGTRPGPRVWGRVS